MSKTKEVGIQRRIVVDTREKRPYEFDNALHKALIAGDYSIEGLENRVAIERKSLEDWVNTVLRSRKRFSTELTRLRDYEFAAVVIEGSMSDILAGSYKSNIEPAALVGITSAIITNYHPVHVIFGGDRIGAYAITKAILDAVGKSLHD